MAAGDQFLFDVAQRAMLNGLTDPDAIAYRQAVLTDCLASSAVVRGLYDLAVAAVEGERKVFYSLFFRDSPEVILHRSVEVLQFFSGLLKTLRTVADEQAGNFRSAGFTRLFSMLSAELSDEYFAEIEYPPEHAQVPPRGADQRQARFRATWAQATSCASRASRAGGTGCRWAGGTASASRSPTATRAACGPCPSCRAGASTWSPTQPPSPPTTSSASSGCSALSWPSTSAA